MTSYDLTPRVFEAVTASASLAVIKTASKHLHNDLARAIEALEQKKNSGVSSGILGWGTCFQESTLESWVAALAFKSQLWNLGVWHLFSGVNSGILALGRCFQGVNSGILGWGTWFQESTLESWLWAGVFKSQLWKLGLGHLLSRVNSGILALGMCFHEVGHLLFRSQLWNQGCEAPVFRSQLWNLGFGHLFSRVNSGIRGWGTLFQESGLELW